MKRIYLDYAATTPLDPEVGQAMQPYFLEHFANPSSLYFPAQKAQGALLRAREKVAGLLGCAKEQIFFTSSATESNNWVLKGFLWASERKKGKKTLLIGPAEHSSILEPARYLAKYHGFQLLELAPNAYGQVDLEDLAAKASSDVALASISYASSDIGSLQPLAEIKPILDQHSIPLHIDAAQAPNECPLPSLVSYGDFLTLSSHKIYGPRGAALLYINPKHSLDPLIHGGDQEFAMRAGTENLPAIVGFSLALEKSQNFSERAKIFALNQGLRKSLAVFGDQIKFTGHPEQRLGNHTSLVVPGRTAYDLLIAFDIAGVSLSAGSACVQGQTFPLEILRKLGFPEEQAKASLRFTLGKQTGVCRDRRSCCYFR